MIAYDKLIEKIEERTAKIIIWGCGFVGMTNMLYLVKTGFKCVGIDVNTQRVAEIKEGKYNINSDMDEIGELTEKDKQLFEVTDDYSSINMMDYDIHMLCLPTEKDFKPTTIFLEDVINKIGKSTTKQFLLIIESSMPPKYIDESIINGLKRYKKEEYVDYVLGAAPRRDLFGDAKFNLKKTKRVIGADNEKTINIMEVFYGTFCNNLVIAKDCYHAVLSKIVENTYRCFDISLANQLAVAFTNFDITHVLELAATKWNVEKYHPSFGIGGYCIPLAPQYIFEQMEYENIESSIFEKVLDFNNNCVTSVINLYKNKMKVSDKILVMGLSSIPNVGIINCSIGIEIVKQLKKHFEQVYVNDPYIDDVILKKEAQCETWGFDSSLADFDIIFVITQHDKYKEYAHKANLKKSCIIIDSFGVWKNFDSDPEVQYFEIGRKMGNNS